MAATKTKKAGKKKTAATEKATATEKAPGKKEPAAQPVEPDATVSLDRRSSADRRTTSDRRKKSVPVVVERRKIERRAKVNRRRQIDPTTCERDYSADEIEFMNAMDEYKRASGRMFPTCSEILEVISNLGYAKRPSHEPGEPGGSQPEGPSEPAPGASDG